MKKLTTTRAISLIASVTFSASFSTPTWAHGQHVNTQPWVVCAEAKHDELVNMSLLVTNCIKVRVKQCLMR